MSYPQYGSILQNWVVDLPLRHQGVLIAAVRGCDGTPKENSAKPIVRALRGAFLNPADEREMCLPSSFMTHSFEEYQLVTFLKDWDHYPMHFIQHLMHACQVIGYKHPIPSKRSDFGGAYFRMVMKLHLNPESCEEMDKRLCEDRIALYAAANPPE